MNGGRDLAPTASTPVHDTEQVAMSSGVASLRTCHAFGGFFDGAPFEFASGLNCIIGNRGTGKTTALELVRYALDDLGSDPKQRRRVEALIQQNLGGGRVELEIETADGIRYTISRTAGEAPIVYTADGEPTTVAIGSGGIFRAEIFSQNEVESIASDPRSQLELLDSLLGDELLDIERQIAEAHAALATVATGLIEIERQQSGASEQLSELPAVEEALRKLGASSGESGDAIDKAHAAKALRDRERTAVDETLEFLRELHADVTRVSGTVAAHLSRTFDEELLAGPNAALLRDAIEKAESQSEVFDRAIASAADAVIAAGWAVREVEDLLKTEHAKQETEFRKLIEKHKEAQQQSAERAKLEKKRNMLKAAGRSASELESKVSAMREERAEMLQHLSELRDRRFRLRSEKAAEITERLGPDIRVRVEQFGNRDVYRAALEEQLAGASINRKVVASRIADQIAPAELVDIVRRRDEQELIDKAGINPNQAIAVIEAYADRTRQCELETVELTDRPSIELLDGEVYKDSLSLSTGQKCTAILPIIMLDSANPLLIDQPEDNLDNRFMVTTIVNSIRKVKSRRQLIFVTHNPNIPVLGQADRVFVLASDGRHGRIARVGTVDDCREDIVTLLEGGREAFMERKERYGY